MRDINTLQELYHSYLTRMQSVKDELAAAGALLKDEPHASLYIWATRELNASRDRQALLVLLEIANHCDEFGWCFPSIQRLGKLTGYDHNPGSTVESAVSRLMAKDWLRVRAVRNVVRRRTETDFVLSPQVLFIRPELRDMAWERFNEVPRRNSWGEIATNLTKPDTEPTPVTTFTNQIHEPDTEPPPPPSPEDDLKKSGFAPHGAQAPQSTTRSTNNKSGYDPTQSRENGSHDSAERNSEATDSAARNSPPHSAPPPPHPPLPAEFDAAQELPDPQDEAAAQELYRNMRALQIKNARRYVVRYGRDKCRAAASVALRTPHVKNPVGKMDYDLRSGSVDESDFDWVEWSNRSALSDAIQR